MKKHICCNGKQKIGEDKWKILLWPTEIQLKLTKNKKQINFAKNIKGCNRKHCFETEKENRKRRNEKYHND
jgi:hypothetical protein